jgi:putative pyruvate formate lyase activating enzyme
VNNYLKCSLCPRECLVDRSRSPGGFCGQSAALRIAWAGLHFGEEPPVSGEKGSGAIFFSGCTLKCSFCQNYQLSHLGFGRQISTVELGRIMLSLEREGAENINLVSGSHFTPSILEAIEEARKEGLSLPIVWNSSGYENRDTLEMLFKEVDIFLADLKTLDRDLGKELFKCGDYPLVAAETLKAIALRRENRSIGGKLQHGMIVRHLVLPGCLQSSLQVLSWFRENLYHKCLLSLMFQYTPVIPLKPAGSLNRRVSREEYEVVLDCVQRLNIERGFIQEPGGVRDYLPDFEKSNPFLPNLARTLRPAVAEIGTDR